MLAKIVAFKVRLMPLIALILLAYNAQPAQAFDAADYQGLADATSSATIPPGTIITAGNWQQYKQFIPVSLQWLYSGKYPWKVPAGDDFSIVVGPTVSIPMTHQFAIDTEKYSNQVKLDPMPNGGFDIKGYVAGLPFPHPAGPNAGIEILYNFYYHYQPHVLKNYYRSLTIDRYQNESATEIIEVFNRLMHTSDVNTPIDNPLAGGYFQSGMDEVTVPEQSKYTSALTMFPDDVKRLEEFYVFLPSLRRSLRLSSAARCSPILGSDYLNDDNRDGFNGIPTQFKVTLLGEKKIISLVHEESDHPAAAQQLHHHRASRLVQADYRQVGTTRRVFAGHSCLGQRGRHLLLRQPGAIRGQGEQHSVVRGSL